jgi:hypothetical protein
MNDLDLVVEEQLDAESLRDSIRRKINGFTQLKVKQFKGLLPDVDGQGFRKRLDYFNKVVYP